MNKTLIAMVLAAVRWLGVIVPGLMTGAAWAESVDWAAFANSISNLITAGVAVGAFAWSIWDKYNTAKKLKAAIAAPAGMAE